MTKVRRGVPSVGEEKYTTGNELIEYLKYVYASVGENAFTEC